VKAEKLIPDALPLPVGLAGCGCPFSDIPLAAAQPGAVGDPLMLLISWLASREPIPATPLNGSLLLMALMVLVSLWATYDLGSACPRSPASCWGLPFFGHRPFWAQRERLALGAVLPAGHQRGGGWGQPGGTNWTPG